MNHGRRARHPNPSHPNLCRIRTNTGMSQDELGYMTGIAQSRISRAERGMLWLSDIERAAIARALMVRMSDLDTVLLEHDEV